MGREGQIQVGTGSCGLAWPDVEAWSAPANVVMRGSGIVLHWVTPPLPPTPPP